MNACEQARAVSDPKRFLLDQFPNRSAIERELAFKETMVRRLRDTDVGAQQTIHIIRSSLM